MALLRDVDPVVGKTPPQNVELEMSVLGAIMLEPKSAYPLAAEFLSGDSFYLDGHNLIFELMGELYHRGIPPDSVAVMDELRSRGVIDQVGGPGVVMGMLNSVPTAANIEYHARKVADKAHLRNLIRVCTEVIEECYKQEQSVEQVVERAESEILELSRDTTPGEFIAIADVLAEYMEKLGQRMEQIDELKAQGVENPQISVGLPTQFLDLDTMTGGLRASELTIIGARPSMGKTALALNFAHNIAVGGGVPVALFSLEMGVEQLAERLLCLGTKYTRNNRISGISTSHLLNPDLDDMQWSILQKSFERLCQAPIYIDDSSMLSVGSLKSKVRRLYTQHGIRCIIVDYLQLMHGRSTENRVQEVSEISRGLKQVARELKIPVVALSQLSRQGEQRASKRPQLSDLRESGAIEQDADVVMFIHRPDYYEEKKEGDRASKTIEHDLHTMSETEIIVAKNRNGPTGVARTLFFKEITRFLDKSGR